MRTFPAARDKIGRFDVLLLPSHSLPVTRHCKLSQVIQSDVPHWLRHGDHTAASDGAPAESGHATIPRKYHLRGDALMLDSSIELPSGNNVHPRGRYGVINDRIDARPGRSVVLGSALDLNQPVAHFGGEATGDVLGAASLGGESLRQRALLDFCSDFGCPETRCVLEFCVPRCLLVCRLRRWWVRVRQWPLLIERGLDRDPIIKHGGTCDVRFFVILHRRIALVFVGAGFYLRGQGDPPALCWPVRLEVAGRRPGGRRRVDLYGLVEPDAVLDTNFRRI